MSTTAEKTNTRPVVAPADRLKGKVALITGGTRGIGLAIAKAYALEGAKVIIASRTSSELKTALGELKELGADATGTKVNLNSWDSCKGLHTGAIRTYGKVDILVNNAAVLGPRESILKYPVDEWDKVMRTNTDVVFWMSKAALGSMIPENTGSIINVISGVAYKGRANWGAYSVSKAAVVNLTEVLAEEVATYNIRVNAVNPGPTATSMRAEAFPKEDPETLPKAEEITNPFIYLGCDVSKGVSGSSFDAKDWIGRSF